MRRIIIALLAMTLVACGANQPTVTPTQTGIRFSADPNTVIVERVFGAGFTMPIYARMLEAPQVRIYGDGRVIYRYTSADGMKSEWQETKLADGEFQALLRDVVGDTGDLCIAGDIADPDPMVTDMGGTTISINTDKTQCNVSVYAAEVEQRGTMSADVSRKYAQFVKANKALDRFTAVARNPYKPELVTIYREDGAGGDQVPLEWTFSQKPINSELIKGDEAAALLQQAAMPAQFVYEGQSFFAVAVPKLP